ncbi:phosphatidylinositol-specific phospholipase C/glycerophosphodiester phosphodiesterase family protein [soil metagenome]
MNRFLTLVIVLGLYLQPAMVTAQIVPLPAHSHNDYERERPLLEALELGYRSIEVDIHLHKGQLRVSHDPFMLDGKPTLQELYLDPLLKITRTEAAKYGLDSLKPLIIMIDFKDEGEKTYQVLKPILERYKEMLTVTGLGAKNGYVHILISGDKPYTSVAKETTRLVSLDYKFEFCREHADDTFITRSSDTYKKYFTWNGQGEMPWKEKLMLDELINQAHAEGRQIRFWAGPETPELWKLFLDMGVDWIHVDDIKAFQKFYLAYIKTK